MSEPTGRVQTVLEDIEPSALGFTHTHEHVFVDLTMPPLREAPISERRAYYERISPESHYRIRRLAVNQDNLVLIDEEVAVEELRAFKDLGGGAIVDATSIGLGRDPEALVRVSRATDLHIVMGSGYYVADYQPAEVASLSEEQITERIVRDITEGVDGTGIKAGVIGEIGMSWPVHDDEVKVLRAAAQAQSDTGAPLMIHPGRSEEAPLHHVRVVEEAGGNPERVIMSHVDRTLFGLESITTLVETGCYVEFDLFGQESSYYAWAPIDMPNDATRIDYLIELTKRGYRDKLLIAQDSCQKTHLMRYGGEGYGHILRNVLPVMQRKGMSEDDVDAILLHNPARLLAV
ncbi:MAG: Phosphotriesterase related protein [uncultured Chloroflexia bacterium]|uniref:Phosphotriesterase related protein n=1 Tax=uncultured Chloroflexia bacterium TaxID=1672391 RepID=A0A6J4M472_9CHLR|nr:MAG: Phosphotriesterase related protein [uncultured Chloroflexia bacterium]